MSRSIMLFALAICVVGCGGGGGKGGSTPPNLPNPLLAEANINAQRGGDVAVTDTSSALVGTKIKVPPGALANDTRIAISAAQVQQLPTPTRPTSIGPSGTAFAIPASVELTYDPGLIQPGDDPENLIVMVQDVNGNTEVYVEPIVNSSLRLATITTTHLSLFEVFFPWEYKLFRQPQRLIDSRPERYEMGVSIFTLLTGGLLVKEYHPIIANGPANITATFGKGTATDFFTTDTGNILFLHGLFSTPANFQFDDQGLPNDNDLLAFLKTKPNVKNILHYQYQSGWPIAFNAKVLSDLITKNANPRCRFTIVAHSMGGLVARHAIEQHDIGQYVENLITLGTPHEGAPKYKLSPLLSNGASFLSAVTIPGIEDLLVRSTFLTNLNAGYPGKKPASLPYYAIAGQENATATDDGVVTTISATGTTSLRLSSSNAVIVPNTDHNALHTNARNNSVAIKIREWVTGKPNATPIANAGQDQTVTVNTQVTLAGSATDADQDTLTYAWTQTAGPNVTIANANTATAMFTPTQTGTYTFTLTASDTVATGTDTVTITVVPGNGTPVANAGADRTVTIGVLVSLDGSGSSDPDNDPLTYRWIQIAGTSVVLSNAKTVAPTLVPSSADTYTFSLIVNDGNVDSAIDTVTITVNPPPINRATFYPVVDTYTGDQAYNSANPNRATLPSFLIGDDGAGQNFWGRVSFDPVSTIVPPNVTITKATFTLHEKTVWKNDTVSIEVGGGFWVYPQTGGSAAIDVTSEFQKLLTSPFAGLPLFSFLISTSNTQHAYLEYHSSESGAATTPSFTIEWQ